MIISRNDPDQTEIGEILLNGYWIYYRGFLYMPSVPSGIESIAHFLKDLDAGADILSLASKLKGQYFIYIKKENSSKRYLFTDESGNFHAFYSDQHVSDSFLELSKHLGLGLKDFNPYSVAEFVHWGNFHYDRTFFDSIKKIKGDQLLIFDESGVLRILAKANCSIENTDTAFSFPAFFDSFCRSIKDEKVVVDLTGGIDSRLFVSILEYHKLDFDLAVSGIKGNEDVNLAIGIAQKMNKKINVTYHSVDAIEKELDNVFKITDGLSNIVSYHRAYQLSLLRKNHNYTLSISGAGGEVYKDFPWLQDFPFYSKRKPDFNRFYDFRFCPIVPDHSILSGPILEASWKLKDRIISEWERMFVKNTNSQTYDNLYFSYKWPAFAGRFITNISKMVPCYAPFLELDLGKFTYALPRRDRKFNRLHRKWISYYSPMLSKFPTTEGGMSVSDKRSFIVIDGIRYLLNRGKRLSNKVGQRVFRRSLFPFESPNHPELFSAVKQLDSFASAVRHLKDVNIINDSVEPGNIHGKYVGSLYTLSKVIRELNQ